MYVVRDVQLIALQKEPLRALVPALLEHAHAFHAERAAALGEEGLSRRVDGVLAAAADYRLPGLRLCARFLDLAMVLGLPLPARIDAILRDASAPDPVARLHRAWKQALFRLEVSP